MGSRLGRTVLAAGVAAIAATLGCGEASLNDGQATGAAGSAGSGNSGGTTGTSTGGMTGTSTGGTTGTSTGGAAGTSAAGAAGSCGPQRLTASEASSLYTKYAFEVQPSLNPTTVFEAHELEVEGLWGALNAQLFDVGAFVGNGGTYRQCTILTRACEIFVPAGECSQFRSPLSSGVVANGAFYFSWAFGSGVLHSQIGKLTADGTPFTRVVSAVYTNASEGPPPVVVQRVGTDIRVYRASPTAFNQWSNADDLGTLDDRGDALIVVDSAGRPLADPLP